MTNTTPTKTLPATQGHTQIVPKESTVKCTFADGSRETLEVGETILASEYGMTVHVSTPGYPGKSFDVNGGELLRYFTRGKDRILQVS